jgi:Spy/CpxP family protein refolding chaperone
MVILRRLLLTIIVVLAAPALAQTPTTTAANADMEMLMQKIKADRKLLVAANMDLTDAEAKQFWPLYDAYQKELERINEHLGQTIKEYAEALDKGPIPDDTATKLMNEALSSQEAEIKLKRTYAAKIGKVLRGAKTARFIQMENRIRAVLNAEIARQIPLVY